MKYYYLGQKKALGQDNAKLRLLVSSDSKARPRVQMQIGDKWVYINASSSLLLIPATRSVLGGVIVGDNMKVTPLGVISPDYSLASLLLSGLMSSADKVRLDSLVSSFNRLLISRSTTLLYNDWAICSKDCTITLPKVEKGKALAVSTTGGASEVIIVPASGDVIIKDLFTSSALGLLISKKNAYVLLFGSTNGWVIARIDNGDLIIVTSDSTDTHWKPVDGGGALPTSLFLWSTL